MCLVCPAQTAGCEKGRDYGTRPVRAPCRWACASLGRDPASGRPSGSCRMAPVALVAADALARAAFPDRHPFGPDRQEAFLRELRQSAAYGSLQVMTPRVAEREELEYFHDRAYV